MGVFADKTGMSSQKAWNGLPSPPCSSTGVLEHEECFISWGFDLGDELLVWMGEGIS